MPDPDLKPESKRRRTVALVLAASLLPLVLVVAAQSAFNLKFLRPLGTGQILIFAALSAIVFLLFLLVLILLLRNILKLYVGEQSRVLGARLRTRMWLGAILLSFAPAVFMYLFSFQLMNRTVDRWFSQPVAQMRDDATRVAEQMTQYAASDARSEANSLAESPILQNAIASGAYGNLLDEMRSHRTTLMGGFIVVYHDGQAVGQYQLPQADAAEIHPWVTSRATTPTPAAKPEPASPPATREPLLQTVLHAAEHGDEPIVAIGDREFALGATSVRHGGLVVVGLPVPAGLDNTVREIQASSQRYWELFRERRGVRTTYMLLLLLMTTLVFFTSSWLALFLSKQITRPVEALADAMDAIGNGEYARRIDVAGLEELGELLRSFNRMAADLEGSRQRLQSSTAQLSSVNVALEERRRELETVLETIPSGVVTLDESLHIVQANRAFAELLDAGGEHSLNGARLESLIPAEAAGEFARLARRSIRMGIAGTELEIPGPRGPLNLVLTVAVLKAGKQHKGFVVVLENMTELLRAQKQMAWKEVAQRVAHEIKNPLTPIGLSAERIRRHLDRNSSRNLDHPAPLTPESAAVIRSCSEVISSSVESMRTLVDQFSALAQFPVAQPKPVSLNGIVENTLAMFAGRLSGIRIEMQLQAAIPLVLADPEALQRALANLIDNAAEAMQGSLHQVLTVCTESNEERSTAELIVADTGHGLTDEMRERLFLPYFSTKRRGTGLGLSIAAKIVQEHRGTIRAEQNQPAGARFIVELPLAEAVLIEMPAPRNSLPVTTGVGK